MPITEFIVSDPKVMMGKPVVRGTRITVELILEKLAAGETKEQLLLAHVRLTREAIHAALAFAADALRTDVVYPVDCDRLAPEELGVLAKRLAATSNPVEAARTKKSLQRGFYGS